MESPIALEYVPAWQREQADAPDSDAHKAKAS